MARRNPGLHVWLYGREIAVLDEPSRFRYRLRYSEQALDELGVGARALSISLPVTRAEIRDSSPTNAPVGNFLAGLLPEGNLLTQVAQIARIPVTDAMGLLKVVGRECAGAVQFLPEGERPTEGRIRPLNQTELEIAITSLPSYVLPGENGPQASLAGIQDKLLLARTDTGWGLPEGAAASTHVIKPEPQPGAALPGLIESEDWALKVARRAGLAASESSVRLFGDRKAIVIRRYDRTSEGNRTHQEDFCQALGLNPASKYESPSTGPSRLASLVELAGPRALDPETFRRDLLQAITFNAIIGNGDAHSKNYSLLLDERGRVNLAPLYDCAPVYFLSSRFATLGQLVNGKASLRDLCVDDLVEEAGRWRMGRREAREIVHATIERTWDAAQSVEPPDDLPAALIPALEHEWATKGWRQAQP